ncbi:glycosyltransferase family 4 protein [Billgrantia aerodenitrificans]|uniref:Glycosyltransferase family 4 protein n=1 Tax=Billgrantia aerodenitrificans TaxID=2733483 RepID=A0ABS9AVS1_9GAMM|nr:glycosyltransferase family 4 protein [Halomonas aerodenitrificans]MCE8025743.1 glycosyltransferase family 4 protein [Halomonas aerodenitrificans]
MYIFILLSNLNRNGGGRETWLMNFIPKLAGKVGKDKVEILHLKEGGVEDTFCSELSNYSKMVGIERPAYFPKILWRSPLKFYISSWIIAKKLKKFNKEDVVVAVGSLWEPLAFRSRMRCRRIIWIRSILEKEINQSRVKHIKKILLWKELRVLKSAHHLISNGLDTQKAYVARGVDSVYIPNCIDVSKYTAASKEKLKTNPVVVSYIGRLSKEKGFLEFLRSIEIFNQKYKCSRQLIEFHVVGQGRLEGEMESVRSFDNFRYLGPISNNEIAGYLSGITANVCLTFSNQASKCGGGGVSNGMLEGMAAGRVMICWDNYTFKQSLDDRSAIFVAEGSCEQLAEAYYALATNLSEFHSLGGHARDRAKRYSLDKAVASFLNVAN